MAAQMQLSQTDSGPHGWEARLLATSTAGIERPTLGRHAPYAGRKPVGTLPHRN
jgi:hypothetical protein